MLMIRLQRVGKKKEPHYRVVLTEKTTSPKGKFIELLGNYDSRAKTKSLVAERITYWISKGAKLSDTVTNLLISEKIIEGTKIAKHKIVPAKPVVEEVKKPAEVKKVEKVEKVEKVKKVEEVLEAKEPEAEVKKEEVAEAPEVAVAPVEKTEETTEEK